MSLHDDPNALTPVHVAALGSYSPSAPGFRIRMLLYRAWLADQEVFLTPLTLFTEEEGVIFRRRSAAAKLALVSKARKRLLAGLKSLSSDLSVTWIQRQGDLFPFRTVEEYAIADRPLVYDVDDAIWLNTRSANGSVFALLKRSRRKAHWLAQRAAHVVAGNEVLADYLAHYTQNLTVIPSVVDTAALPVKRHSDGESITVGWIGSPTTAPYVDRIESVLTRLANELRPRRVRLLMVGGSIKPPKGVTYESVSWSTENERRALGEMDIGLMPQPNTPWTRGKCAYKAVQYMAGGIPVVADDVGVTARVVSDGGIVVRSEAEWLEAFLGLARDTKLRSDLGVRGRRQAESEYSIERWAPCLAHVLRNLG